MTGDRRRRGVTVPVTAPPYVIVSAVEARAPGIYRAVVDRFNEAGAVVSEGQVESWYRGADWNAEVGGAPDSQHLLGLAIDTSHATAASAKLLAERLRARGFVVVEKRSAATGRHLVHAQAWPAGTARRAGLLG